MANLFLVMKKPVDVIHRMMTQIFFLEEQKSAKEGRSRNDVSGVKRQMVNLLYIRAKTITR